MRASRRRCLRAVSGGRCNAPRLRSLAPLETKEGTGCLHPVTAEFPDAFRFPHGFQAPTPSWSWLTSPPPSLRVFFPHLEHELGSGTAPCSRDSRNRVRGRISDGAPSCPGQLPKGVLMDAQTVVAVCELLLVVVAGSFHGDRLPVRTGDRDSYW